MVANETGFVEPCCSMRILWGSMTKQAVEFSDLAPGVMRIGKIADNDEHVSMTL